VKIFITGGTGFIGQHLIKCLEENGHDLVCLVRSTSNTDTLQKTSAKLVTGDITDKTSIKGLEGCNWLVHLASNFEFWVPDSKIYKDVNVIGITNVMEAALEADISKVVVVSTGAVFGNAPWPITEESQPGDHRPSQYAQTKYEGELIAWDMYQKKGLPLVIIYPSAVLGPNDPKAAGRYLRNIALGRMPAQVFVDTPFPFVHVRDVCEGILLALEKRGNIGKKYILGKEVLTWGEFNSLICEVAGSRLPFLKLPDWLTVFSSRMLTTLSHITKKPPLLDLSRDQVDLMKQGFVIDGHETEQELGIIYTPVRKAVEDAVMSIGIVLSS
jgi:dihydroflavonol-4-reductase